MTLLDAKSPTECSCVSDPSGFTIVKFPEKTALAPAVSLSFVEGDDDEEL
jgi:hypothetical protein